jgi:hypothetical protein
MLRERDACGDERSTGNPACRRRRACPASPKLGIASNPPRPSALPIHRRLSSQPTSVCICVHRWFQSNFPGDRGGYIDRLDD